MKLGDRIKRYEAVSHYSLTARTPVMIRVDGRAFHTFTRGMKRPFDGDFIKAMASAAIDVAADMQGFKAAYIQSDEATFCITDYDNIETQGWFDYDLSKIVSLSASLMSVRFAKHFHCATHTPVFDSRAFNIPANDVINAFLWRAKDWERNSLQMYSRAFYSHKDLHGKKREDMHEMLYKAGKNWATDLTMQEKNGTFLIATDEGLAERHDIEPRYDALKAELGTLFEYEL